MVKIENEFIPELPKAKEFIVYLCFDPNGIRLEKGDKVEIKNHSNLHINGSNYMILRRWEMREEMFECVRESNGIVEYVAVHKEHIFKRKEE